MIAREIVRFMMTEPATFLGTTALRWWSRDPCRTQYLRRVVEKVLREATA
jgi:hypothetical protein